MAEEITGDRIDISRFIRPGDTVVWSQGTGEPLTLTEALVAGGEALKDVSLLVGSQFAQTLRPEHADIFAMRGFGGVGRNRDLTKAGVLDVIPCHLSDLAKLVRRGTVRADVVFLQMSPEDANGSPSLGAINAYMELFVAHARTVVVEINDQAPWSYGTAPAVLGRIDAVVRTSRPMLEVQPAKVGPVEERIAAHVAGYIEDGSVLQIGIGALPDAVLATISDRRDIGIHSGVIGDRVADLMEAGVVTNATKPIDRGVTVTGLLFGTRRLYDAAHRNRAIAVRSTEHTHDAAIIARMPRFVSLNSAIEVDLTGQVNCEIAGDRYLGTVGGFGDFARAARLAERGVSIVALPSTTGDGKTSKIVKSLAGGIVTSPRSDTDVVVTEHGIAELAGQPISVRTRRMIAIADPAQREDLERSAHQARQI